MEVEVFSRMGLVYLGYANECDLKMQRGWKTRVDREFTHFLIELSFLSLSHHFLK